ncbi:transmembrane protein, putative (macronuclear) [Tetrahymena thermophila SB210]|uniref:Transmembrane protein, putative n=1 Tax=Tetrahymena thermophila (strain SB210) TaxID=312017 RepID=Q22KE0_TETTS|nr:transmembrane protein, putative [Tetrahymena thermophila SB210]EAR85859.2 transmembrane protein, putative [Tetrahymena thermophila SB210]|eukprot:XP_001033522.2 transmembrane protein, putative [Tetrahymena thermophila SB210]
MSLLFISVITFLIKYTISQVQILNETFKQLTYDDNLANTENYWVSQPPFSEGGISYQCLKSLEFQPQLLLMGPNQQLTKVFNALSLTKGKYFYKFNVTLNLLLIDMNRSSFSLSLTFNGKSVTFPQQGQSSYTSNSKDFYCYEALTYLIPCSDYCFGQKYDSQISISNMFSGYQDNIQIQLSSNAINDEQVGIISLQIEAYLCDPNCLKCQNSPTQCIQCQNSSQAIDFEQQNCVDSCPSGYYQTNDASYPLQQVCKKCEVQNCEQCTSGMTCFKCSDGYYFDGSQCSQCDSLCGTCSTSASLCLTCSDGYYMATGSICTPCPTGCSSCSSNTYCSSCNDGYYQLKVDSQTATCNPCLQNCKSCTDNTSCKECFQNKYLYNNDISKNYYYQCVTDCGNNQFISNDNSKCIKFQDSNCINASPSQGCQNGNCNFPQYSNFQKECVQSCQDGFYKGFKDPSQTFTQCYKCPQGNQKCSSQNYSIQCENGYYLQHVSTQQQNCLQCEQNCDSCTNGVSCKKCSKNYNLDGATCVQECSGSQYSQDQICKNCPIQNCLKCKDNKVCVKCKPGYDIVNGICEISCTDGQFRSLKTLKCTSCLSGCKVCTSLIGCQECFPRYFGQQTCSKCDQSCYNCQGLSPNQCTSCDPQSNLFLYQNQCIPKCPNGYFNDTSSMSCVPCNDPNCKVCDKGTNTCSLCSDPDLYLVDNQTCSSTCQQDHQNFTKNNIKQCLKLSCPTGYYQVEDKCKEICGDGLNFGEYQCDDGNNLNGDGCSSICGIEYLFVCHKESNHGKSICYLPLSYKASSQNKNQVILQFLTDVQVTQDFIKYLKISLEGLKSSAYTYALSNSKQSNMIKIEFQFNIQVQNTITTIIQNGQIQNVEELTLTKSPKGSYILDAATQTVQMNTEYVAQESQKQAAQSIQATSKAISTTVIASLVPITLSGGITLVASIIDIAQIIKLHKYLDIEFPVNLELYFTVFEDFSFPFVTNFFEYAIPEHYEKPTFEVFEQKDLQALFIKNAGQHYTLFIFTAAVHLLLKLIGIKFKMIGKFVDKLFIYAIYHEVVMSVYLELVFNILLQFTNMSVEKPVDYLNLTVMMLTIIFVLPIPFAAAYLMKKHFHRLKEKDIEEKFGSLYEGLKHEYICMIYFIILHFRKILISLLIIYFYQVTIVQCAILSIMPLLLLAFVIKKQPFQHKKENIKMIIQEICFSICCFLFIGLKSMDGSLEENRIQISWAIITFFTIILLLHFYFSMREIYYVILKKPTQFIFVIIVKFCQKLRNQPKKVSPQSTISSKKDNQDQIFEKQNLQKSIISCNNSYSKKSSIEQQLNINNQEYKKNYSKEDAASIENYCMIDQAKQKTANIISNNQISCQDFSQVNTFRELQFQMAEDAAQKIENLVQDAPQKIENLVQDAPQKIENFIQIPFGRRIPRAFTYKNLFKNQESGFQSPNTNRNSTRFTEFPSTLLAQQSSCDVSFSNKILANNNQPLIDSPSDSARQIYKSKYSNIIYLNNSPKKNQDSEKIIENEDDFNNTNQIQIQKYIRRQENKQNSFLKIQNSNVNTNNQKIQQIETVPYQIQQEQNSKEFKHDTLQDLQIQDLQQQKNSDDDNTIQQQIKSGLVIKSLKRISVQENNLQQSNSIENQNLEYKDQSEKITSLEKLNQKMNLNKDNQSIKLAEEDDFDQNFSIIQSSKSIFFRSKNQSQTGVVTSGYSKFHQKGKNNTILVGQQ